MLLEISPIIALFPSCTNTMYKIVASLLQKRLASFLDEKIRPAQFSFRANRSTSQPIHIMRRMLEAFERQQHNLHLLFLDWSKAFDSVTFAAIEAALTRFGIPPLFLKAIMSLYSHPKFRVRDAGQDIPLLYIHRQEDSDRDARFLLISLTLSSLIFFAPTSYVPEPDEIRYLGVYLDSLSSNNKNISYRISQAVSASKLLKPLLGHKSLPPILETHCLPISYSVGSIIRYGKRSAL